MAVVLVCRHGSLRCHHRRRAAAGACQWRLDSYDLSAFHFRQLPDYSSSFSVRPRHRQDAHVDFCEFTLIISLSTSFVSHAFIHRTRTDLGQSASQRWGICYLNNIPNVFNDVHHTCSLPDYGSTSRTGKVSSATLTETARGPSMVESSTAPSSNSGTSAPSHIQSNVSPSLIYSRRTIDSTSAQVSCTSSLRNMVCLPLPPPPLSSRLSTHSCLPCIRG